MYQDYKICLMLTERTKFDTWLWHRRESGKAFARRAKLSHMTVQKAVRGEKVRIDSARKIVRYCNGELTLADFGY